MYPMFDGGPLATLPLTILLGNGLFGYYGHIKLMNRGTELPRT